MFDKVISACSKGNLTKLKKILKNNPDIDISLCNELAFKVASGHGHLNIVKFLLKYKINISIDDEAAFIWAACNGHLHILEFLLEQKPDIDISIKNGQAFKYTVVNGHFLIIKFLLKIKPMTKCEFLNLEIIKHIRKIVKTILKYQTIYYKITNQKILNYIPTHYLITL